MPHGKPAGICIVWTDDDVLVDPNWLASYGEAAARWPDAAFFGGPIIRGSRATRPRGYGECCRECPRRLHRNLGEQPIELTRQLSLWG